METVDSYDCDIRPDPISPGMAIVHIDRLSTPVTGRGLEHKRAEVTQLAAFSVPWSVVKDLGSEAVSALYYHGGQS